MPFPRIALIVFVLLCSGCMSRAAIPDHSVPHRVAAETTVEVWVQRSDGRWLKTEVRLLEGWWIASPQVVE
jgi:hypothetical protein